MPLHGSARGIESAGDVGGRTSFAVQVTDRQTVRAAFEASPSGIAMQPKPKVSRSQSMTGRSSSSLVLDGAAPVAGEEGAAGFLAYCIFISQSICETNTPTDRASAQLGTRKGGQAIARHIRSDMSPPTKRLR